MKFSELKKSAVVAALAICAACHIWAETWKSDVSEGEWSNVANWSSAVPKYDTEATFNTSATVTLSDGHNTKSVQLANNSRLILCGTGESTKLCIFDYGISGTGTIEVRNAGLYAGNKKNPIFAATVPIEVPVGYALYLGNEKYKNDSTVTFTSPLLGGGTVILPSATGSKQEIKLNGDNSGFTGEFRQIDAGSKQYVQWASTTAGSESASWHIEGTSGDNKIDLSSGGTVKFGELTGTGKIANAQSSAVTLEVGGKNTSFECGIDINSMGLKKVGTGVMRFTGSNAGAVVVENGELTLTAGATVGSLTIGASGTFSIAYDDSWPAGTVTLLTVTDESTAPDADAINVYSRRVTVGKAIVDGKAVYTGTVTDKTTLYWNGTASAWSAADAWSNSAGTENYTFQRSDDVVFGSAANGKTIDVDAAFQPNSVAVELGAGNSCTIGGSGSIGCGLTVNSGTLTLTDDVLPCANISNDGATVRFNAPGKTIHLNDVAITASSSGKYFFDAGEVISHGEIVSSRVGEGEFNVATGATFVMAGTAFEFDQWKGTFAGTGIFAVSNATISINNSTLSGYAGTIRLVDGGTYQDVAGSNYGHFPGASATIEMSNGKINWAQSQSSNNAMKANVSLVEGTTNTIETTGTNAKQYNSEINGALSGEGQLDLIGKVQFTGNNSGFGGVVNFKGGQASYTPSGDQGAYQGFGSVNSGSARGQWNIATVNEIVDSSSLVYSHKFAYTGSSAGTPLKLGAFNVVAGANIYNANAGSYVQIGERNEDCEIDGTFIGETLNIVKKGNSKLTLGSAFAMPSGSSITVSEGSLVCRAASLTGVNVTFADGSGTVLEVESPDTDTTYTLFKTTGTITLNGTQTVASSSTGGHWELSVDTTSEAGYNTLKASFVEDDMLDAKQIVVAAGNTLTISNTSGCGSSGSLSLTEPYAITGAGGCLFGANTLTLNQGGILVLDPPCVPVKMDTAPTLNGGKFALAAKYKHNTVGRFTLLTWTDGSNLSVTADNFTNTTSAASFSLSVEDGAETNVKQLVLTLGAWATAKKAVTILPIGDSITEGANVSSGGYTYTPNYRIPLWNKLAAAGYDVTSVGWLKTNHRDGAGVKAQEAWQSHSGRGGEKLLWWPESDSSKVRGAVRESLEALLDQAGEPDVILLKIGTNDIIHDSLAQGTYIASLTNVIWRALDYRPGARIVVSTLVKLNTTELTTLTESYNEEIRKFAGVSNVYGFPADRVFVADNAPVVTGFNSDNIHPSWIGHNQMSDCWFTAVTNAIETTATLGTFAKTTTSGAANNVDEAYRSGFKRAARLNLATDNGNLYHAKNTAITYDMSDAEDGAATENIARVGYYLELKRRGSDHRRWVWVDVPASAFASRTLAGCGFPANYSKWGQVSGVHIASNDPAVHQVLPSDDSVSARLEFTSASYQRSVTSESGAPSGYGSQFDWNDQEGSESYGSFQIHRIFSNGEYFDCPAEVVFAFNHWSAASGNINEVGIGNFAQQVDKTIDYTLTGQADNTADGITYSTMNAKAYDVISLEIWTKAGAALPAENYLWTGAANDGGKWSNPANWVNEDTGVVTGYYPGENDETGNNYRAVFSNSVYTVDVDVDATIITLEFPAGTAGTTNLVTFTGSGALTLSGKNYSDNTAKLRACNLYIGQHRYVEFAGPGIAVNSTVSTSGARNCIGVNDKTDSGVNGQCSGIITISGGSISAEILYINGSNALVIVKGGNVSLSSQIQINNGGRFEMHHGTISAEGATLLAQRPNANIVLTGGTMNIKKLETSTSSGRQGTNAAIAITGGTFEADEISLGASGLNLEVGSGATITLPAAQATTFYNKVTTFSVDPNAKKIFDISGASYEVLYSAYYKYQKKSDGSGAEYVLDEEKVAPAPVTDGTKAPMDFGTSGKVAFNISNFKKGLYYGIASGVSESSLTYPATLVQCADEATGVTLEADLPESGATFYKIVVSDEQPSAE